MLFVIPGFIHVSDRSCRRFFSTLSLLLLMVIGGGTVGAQQTTDISDTSQIVETNLVDVAVTITDAQGRNVTSLDRNAFSIYDNKQRQEIAWFALDDSPVSIAVVFDLSGSMSRQKMAQAQAALRLFFENSHPQDDYSLIALEGRPRVLANSTRDPTVILQRLAFQPAHGQTALYDACRLAVETVRHSIYKRTAILIISDGQDNDSRWSLDELQRQLKEEDVAVYAIGINDPARVGMAVTRGRNTLGEITAITGGRAFFPFNKEEMMQASEEIALELRSQYRLAYRPEQFAGDGKWHQIQVAVQQPQQKTRLHIRHKAGYYAQLPRRRSNSAE